MAISQTDTLPQHYQTLTYSSDQAERELAAEQLRRLDPGYAEREHAELVTDRTHIHNASRFLEPAAQAEGGSAALIAESVPLRHRPRGKYVGPCPWHSSSSSACLVVWPDEGLWWCSCCRRGGDAVTWVRLVHGISNAAARKRLGLPAEAPKHQGRRRPHGTPLQKTWRPIGTSLSAYRERTP